jgi:hypothetical protein
MQKCMAPMQNHVWTATAIGAIILLSNGIDPRDK